MNETNGPSQTDNALTPVIKVKARVVIRRGNDLLLECRRDNSGSFLRPIGGNIEYGEYSFEAARREFFEETRMELNHLQYLGCVEEIDPDPVSERHEICFLYQATVSNPDLYAMESLVIREDDHREYEAVWVPLGELNDQSAEVGGHSGSTPGFRVRPGNWLHWIRRQTP